MVLLKDMSKHYSIEEKQHLHSNMVLLKVDIETLVVIADYLFTFQYGTT